MKQGYPLVLFTALYKVVLTSKSVDEVLKCDYLNESCCAVLSSIIRLRTNGRNNFQHCCANNVESCCVRVGSGVQMDATTPNNFETYSAS